MLSISINFFHLLALFDPEDGQSEYPEPQHDANSGALQQQTNKSVKERAPSIFRLISLVLNPHPSVMRDGAVALHHGLGRHHLHLRTLSFPVQRDDEDVLFPGRRGMNGTRRGNLSGRQIKHCQL